MSRPAIWTALFAGTRIVPGPVNYNHATPTGGLGHIIVVVFGAHTGASAASATCTINGVNAPVVLERINTSGAVAFHRFFRSATPLAAGTYSIIVGASTPSNHYGTLMFLSLSNWNGTIGAVNGNALNSSAFLSSMGAAHNGANDMPFAVWSVRVGSGGHGALDPDVTTQEIVDGGSFPAAISGVSGLTQVRTLVTVGGTLDTIAGTRMMSATQSGWGTSSLAWTSCAFAFRGSALTLKSIDGGLSFSGAMGRRLALRNDGVGALSFDGVSARRLLATRPLDGALSFAGSLLIAAPFVRIMQASLSFARTMVPKYPSRILLDASLSFMRFLSLRAPDRVALAGTLSFSGLMVQWRKFRRIPLGALRFVGSLLGALAGRTHRGVILGRVSGASRVVGEVRAAETVQGHVDIGS